MLKDSNITKILLIKMIMTTNMTLHTRLNNAMLMLMIIIVGIIMMR